MQQIMAGDVKHVPLFFFFSQTLAVCLTVSDQINSSFCFFFDTGVNFAETNLDKTNTVDVETLKKINFIYITPFSAKVQNACIDEK